MTIQNLLNKRQAIEFLNLDEKVFDNYFRNADEFSCLSREGNRGRFYFDKAILQKWLDGYKWRMVELTVEDYRLCLDFALAMHFRGYVLSDWGRGRQREFGQKVSNWVRGQLGEVAVKHFFKREFDIDVELDFELHKEIVPQDIISVVENGRAREPKVGIGIKASKPKNAYLVLSENEVVRDERRSDYYIFCRPDLPDDHLLRISRDQIISAIEKAPHYSGYKDEIPHFHNIPCEVAGWCPIDELEKVTSIPGQKFDGARFVKKTGNLRRTKEDWLELIAEL